MTLHARGLALALVLASLPVAASVSVAADIQSVAASSEAARSFAYRCEDGTRLSASFSPAGQGQGTADIAFADGRKVVLPQAVSADGGRYVKDDIEFWIKGNGAMLTIADKMTNCTTHD
ncbi:MliC family protein [Kaistia terrae]|uniref:MliC family protein n=1 Tax=Kaistia terrae TaxID=537017 RepID=A0ABW0PTP4_9HYPH|nr:MliC family protein [Kaistia terrae]MCX5576976.1 MliC family protein [Kaistia terrae]